MAKLGRRSGEGTLFDTDGREVAIVAYQIDLSDGTDTGRSWGGELFLRDEELVLEPGLYLLATEDGTRSNVDLQPPIENGGDRRRRRFNGVGSFGDRIA